eukprot:TRINITY_DN65041_c0_g1_i1.p1 TRINITY_DN65041_c0_g1~~TRINITY_DN65041_c0_g1_i1.p1  ORF type:complete len:222 (+),score=31.96 TRINITY_DN65041_c0_g1_i1:66-731(+)
MLAGLHNHELEFSICAYTQQAQLASQSLAVLTPVGSDAAPDCRDEQELLSAVLGRQLSTLSIATSSRLSTLSTPRSFSKSILSTEELQLREAVRGRQRLQQLREKNKRTYRRALVGNAVGVIAGRCGSTVALTVPCEPRLLTPERACCSCGSHPAGLLQAATTPMKNPRLVEQDQISMTPPRPHCAAHGAAAFPADGWDDRTSCPQTIDGKPIRLPRQLLM